MNPICQPEMLLEMLPEMLLTLFHHQIAKRLCFDVFDSNMPCFDNMLLMSTNFYHARSF